MKYNSKKWCSIFLIVCLGIFTGCGASQVTNDSTSSSPTVEELENNSKNKDQVIKEAIEVCEQVKIKVEALEEIDTAMIYINHESVLVALKLEKEGVQISNEIRERVKLQVKAVYPKAITIAISNDPEVYQSISKLVRTFKENNMMNEFIRDIKEIIDRL